MNTNILLLLIGFIFIIGLLGLLVRWLTYRHLTAQTVIVSQYVPPFDLSPAECGYLYDGEIGVNELIGTLLAMQQRKLVVYNGASRTFSLTQSVYADDRTLDYEYSIITYLRTNGPLSLSEMSSNEAVTMLRAQLGEAVRRSLVQKGYLEQSKLSDLIWKIRNFGTTFALAYIVLVVGASFYLAQSYQVTNEFESLDQFIAKGLIFLLAIVPALLTVMYFNFVLYVYYRMVGIPWAATMLLSAHWDEIVGYRIFLEVVEAPRMQQEIDLNNMHQPYCVAFGFLDL